MANEKPPKNTAYDLPEPPQGASRKAISIGYVIAVSVSMVLALNGIIQFFGGNAFTLAQSEQKSAFTVIDKMLDQNTIIISQNEILTKNLEGIESLSNIGIRLGRIEQQIKTLFETE